MRHHLTKAIACTSLILLSACGSTSKQTLVEPKASEPDKAFVASNNPLPWEKGHPERQQWSSELRRQVASNLTSFDKAQDIAAFCPAYTKLGANEKITVISTIVVGIAKFESDYKPDTHYGEPPPLGYDSIGLFQLSYEDQMSWCNMDRATKSLEDPIVNIQCAIPQMARYLDKDKVFSGGTSKKNARGLARYWSVVRDPPGHNLAEIRHFSLSLPICK